MIINSNIDQTRPRVNILLSTYNGEKFLSEQLDSLLSQTYKNIFLFVRDDGSSDHTVGILDTYRKKYRNLKICIGDNCGVVHSFLELLSTVDKPSDLYAFCDQDDVWNPEKIERAVSHIVASQDYNKTLYCTRLQYVDEDLDHFSYSLKPLYVGFKNAVVENISIGCTQVFGYDIRKIVLKGNPEHMMMHDWWVYLVASAFGNIIYDSFPSIKYRQHGNSVTVWEPGFKKIIARTRGLIRRLSDKNNTGLDSLNQAIHFIETYSDIPVEHEKIVDHLKELRGNGTLLKRIKYSINPEVIRTDPLESMLLRPLILFRLH